MEFSPAAHALLKALAIEGGHLSMEAMIRDLIDGECRAFAEALADREDPTLGSLLTPQQRGGRL